MIFLPIRVQDSLPATKTLESENIFVMTEKRALSQDIRPLKIVIVNIMPTKIATETQILRALSNTPLQIDPIFIRMDSHESKNTSEEHLKTFYKTFSEIKNNRYDGLIVTGAPVEMLEFEEVDYWSELCEIFEWSKKHVTSSFFICWAAQAAMYYFYNIQKEVLDEKLFGIFKHETVYPSSRLVRGFDRFFMAPQSRHTSVKREDILKCDDLTILCEGDEAGVYLVKSNDDKRIFVTGHSEYEYDTLDKEYKRDMEKGVPGVNMPKNYYPDDDPTKEPSVSWRAHNHLLFTNWLNYFVYQTTPYNLDD
jgi:homoserine O-succinyltransferase